jgi:4-carboxymuconolactone decarboxylase
LAKHGTTLSEAHPEQMTLAQQEVAAAITAGPRGEVRGPFIALLHNPELAGHVQQLGEHLRWKGKLPARLKEMAVLITARRWTCQHEWVMHSSSRCRAGSAPASWRTSATGASRKACSTKRKRSTTSASKRMRAA